MEYFCENCDAFRSMVQGSWITPMPGDAPNHGYEISDQVCAVCAWIIATLRRPALEVAPALSA